MIAGHHDRIRIRTIGFAHDLVEPSGEEMAMLQGALLSTQPARPYWSARIAAGFVGLIHASIPSTSNREEPEAYAPSGFRVCRLGCGGPQIKQEAARLDPRNPARHSGILLYFQALH